jgi:hypothetical protein
MRRPLFSGGNSPETNWIGRRSGVKLWRRAHDNHSDGYDEFYFLGYNACSPLKVNRRVGGKWRALSYTGFSHSLYFDPEDGDDIFLRNVSLLPMDYMALYPRR